jgi:glutamyl-tRNA synthetase
MQVEGFDHQTLHTATESLAGELGLSNSKLFGVLRVAVTGQKIATPLFESMQIIGRDESLRRIEDAIGRLSELALKTS